ncbi:cytochrome c oxidase subunit III [Mariprofundus micogutta]|uniref:Cytochrome c oxidase subunit III n=1 Tax=Mariprofundus micogutta TaxID=1921010 RepID=A0A1L8CKE8_9PROT|nr:cytochrome c oxidase subunit 3 [Mariprofundus micogutta]GAV19398.1 cytochrome c oxidase subunit III [Mariprofundus micogutta]
MSEEIKHYTAHWHTSPNPLLVGFGAGLFLLLAFMAQFNYQMDVAALVLLAVGAGMTIMGGLGWAAETIGVIDDENWSPSAMFMFIGTEIMTIGGVLAGYWVARLGAPVWPPEGTPANVGATEALYATLLLFVSSFTIGIARKKELNGDASGFATFTLISVAIWAVFMYMTISGWSHLSEQGFTIGINAYATSLYGFTGIHFAHLVMGILVMLTCVPSAFKGKLSFSYTRAMTMYVHFVNVLGFWVLLQVYYW